MLGVVRRDYVNTDEGRVRLGLLLSLVGALLFGIASFGVGLGAVQGVVGAMLALLGLVVIANRTVTSDVTADDPRLPDSSDVHGGDGI